MIPYQPGLDIYFVMGMPATVENNEGLHTAFVRFEDDPPQQWGLRESTDKASLFVAPVYSIRMVMGEQWLRKSHRLLVQFTPFNSSPVTVTFDTRGFETYAKTVLGACPSVDQSRWQFPPLPN